MSPFKQRRLRNLAAEHDRTDKAGTSDAHEAVHDRIYVLLGKRTDVDQEHDAITAVQS